MSMHNGKKLAVIAIDFEDALDALFKVLFERDLLGGHRIHLIHVTPPAPESQRLEHLHSLQEIREIFFPGFPVEDVDYKCIYSEETGPGICDYVSRVNADIVVLFSSKENERAAHYLVTHCPISLLLIRESHGT